MQLRTLLTALAGAALLVTSTPPAGAQDAEADGRYRGSGDPGGIWNIVPPGQDGVVNAAEAVEANAGGDTPPHFQDQLQMYGDLVYAEATPGFDRSKLETYFKDASFGVAPGDVGRVYAPGDRDDVRVIRDASFGVPHIFGDTREGTMFAQGYTGAEDRLFLMDALRHVGRAELAAWLGASEGNLATDADQLSKAPYTEEDYTAQLEDGRRLGPVGERAYQDLLAYTAGVNQYIQEALLDPSKLPAEYAALQLVPEEWIPEDTVAIASLVGGIFGKAGGREVRNLCALDELEAAYGDPATARAVFDDIRFPMDAESPATASDRFTLPELGAVDPASIPDLDCGSLRSITAPRPGPEEVGGAVIDLVPAPPLPDGSEDLPLTAGASFAFPFLDTMSNALLLSSDVTDTGRPLSVFGPQTGYFVPQLLVEKDVHGPGIDARGVAFAGTDLWVQLGRGRDYAFSATSSHVDNVDQFVLRLCDPDGGEATVDSMGYEHDGSCVPIEAHQEVLLAKPSAGGDPTGITGGDPEAPAEEDVYVNKYFERTPHYGPISARGTLTDGTPVAVATNRSTYGGELSSAPGFVLINDPDFMSDGVASFRRAFQQVDYVFNWFYTDAEDIGYQVSCKCPLPADGTDPALPQWGTGEWDWQGELARDELPWDVDPDDGYLISWNNREAHGFRVSDDEFGFGPVHRSSLLERRAREELAEGPISLGEAVDITALAATTDLRSQELMPLLERVMGASPPAGLDDRTAGMWQHLRAWAADDHGHRRDHDADGSYEHAQAIAIMDAWWGDTPEHPDSSRLIDAIFEEGQPIDPFEALGLAVSDGNLRGHVGSAFQDHAYAHPHKDLRQVLGDDVTDPFSRTYCGNGDRDVCASRLWTSLSDTAAALEEEFASPEVDAWRREVADDEIRHSTVGVVGVPPIHWQNRPTFQQVVDLGGTLDEPVAAPPPAQGPRPLPATGGGAAWTALGLVLAVLAVLGRGRRRHAAAARR
ncbi:MAG: penicillin acylase family protein [Actinobacteria bacterium]|nr:penicillin acylase family protein [Actinomycetota bacterium]